MYLLHNELSHCHLNPFGVQALCARLGKHLLALSCRLQLFLETSQVSENFAFLRKKIRFGSYICIHKFFSPNYIHSSYQEIFQMRFI